MASKTLTNKLESIRLLIFNSKDPQVAPLLEKMGIDTTYIEKGEALYNEATRLVDDQKKEYQEQNLAYDKFYLENGRVRAIESWIESSTDFYNCLLNEPDLITKLESFKVTVEQLNAEKTAIENLKQLRNEVTIEKGQAQEATRLRNEKLDELDNYAIELPTRLHDKVSLQDITRSIQVIVNIFAGRK